MSVARGHSMMAKCHAASPPGGPSPSPEQQQGLSTAAREGNYCCLQEHPLQMCTVACIKLATAATASSFGGRWPCPA